MSDQNQFGANFESLESRVLLSGALPAGAQLDLVYDHQGNLHVAYYDDTAHDLKYTMRDTSGTWSAPVTIDNSSGDVGKTPSLAIDAQNRPGIAYRDETNQDLKYAHFDGTQWTVFKVDWRKDTGVNPSLAINAKGQAVISYYRPTTQELRLAQQLGKGWQISTLARKGAGEHSAVTLHPE